MANILNWLDNIRLGYFKHIYAYLRKERKVVEQENIENCIIKVDEGCLKTPKDYTRVRKIIKQLNLTQNELKTLLCFYNQMTYTNITDFLHIDRRTTARRKYPPAYKMDFIFAGQNGVYFTI